MKKCNKCNIERDIGQFHISNRNKSGLQNTCKSCMGLFLKEYRSTTKFKKNKAEQDKSRLQDPKKRGAIVAASIKWSKSENGKETINKNNRKRYDKDLFFRLKCLLRSRIKSIFNDKNVTKGNSINVLGCSYEEAYQYLENTLPIGYNMEDIGTKLHIDHIKPLGLANSEEELYMLSHYTNLHVITIEDHKRKTQKDIIEIKMFKNRFNEAV